VAKELKMDKLKTLKTGRWMRGRIMKTKRKSEIKNSKNLKSIRTIVILKGDMRRRQCQSYLLKSFAYIFL
jgi:hypothetical protein